MAGRSWEGVEEGGSSLRGVEDVAAPTGAAGTNRNASEDLEKLRAGRFHDLRFNWTCSS